MPDLNQILGQLGDVANGLAPRLARAAGVGPLVDAAQSLQAAFTSLKAANGGQAPAQAQASYDALFAKVKGHADSTLGRLEGS